MTASAVDFAPLAPTYVHRGEGEARFAWVTNGHRTGPDPAFDQDLANSDHAAVIPTKGALIPEWLLVVPRTEAISLAALPLRARGAVSQVVRQAAKRVEEVAGASVIFEHGAGCVGSASGCGVDQAHVHVVGLGRSFVQSVLSDLSTSLEWTAADPHDPWADIPKGADYLLLEHDRRAWTALTRNPTSQFMRRRVAHFIGSPEKWDYKCYPHAHNAERTKALFRSFRVT